MKNFKQFLEAIKLVSLHFTAYDWSAPSSTKNKEAERNQEVHQTQNGHSLIPPFLGRLANGLQNPIGVNKDLNLIYLVDVKTHNLYHCILAAEQFHVGQQVVYG